MLPLNYATLDYHSIEILCFRYNELAGVSFLPQQCIALNDFSEGLSNYRIIGYSDYRDLGLLGLRTIGPAPSICLVRNNQHNGNLKKKLDHKRLFVKYFKNYSFFIFGKYSQNHLMIFNLYKNLI